MKTKKVDEARQQEIDKYINQVNIKLANMTDKEKEENEKTVKANLVKFENIMKELKDLFEEDNMTFEEGMKFLETLDKG